MLKREQQATGVLSLDLPSTVPIYIAQFKHREASCNALCPPEVK
jgi:hypothetical protein